MTKSNYYLSTGPVDEKRLGIINQVYNPVSYQFMKDSGLRSGMDVLEIGCGFGHTAIWLAAQVLPSGRVYAIDYSEDSLVIARENAKKAKISNIEFIHLDIANINSLNKKFDFFYGRWVLEFCKPAKDHFKNIYNLLNKGGVLTYEALNFDKSDHFSYPENNAVTKWNDFIVANSKKANSELTLAYDIYNIINEIGFKDTYARRHQPILKTPEEKSLFRLALLSTKLNLIKNHQIAEQDVDNLIDQFVEIENNHSTILGFYNNTLIRGIK